MIAIIIITIVAFLVTLPLLIIPLRAPIRWVGTPAHAFTKRKCPSCSGGIQTMVPDDETKRPEWHKIPRKWNMLERDGGDDVHRAPLANIRDCKECNGMGFVLVKRKNTERG